MKRRAFQLCSGYVGTKLGQEVAPFIIEFILGPSAEVDFVESLESFSTLTIASPRARSPFSCGH